MATCTQCQRVLPDDFMCCPFDGTPLGSVSPRASQPFLLSPTESKLLAGLFDRFDFRAKLGQGGMATVFHAVERQAGVDVAIKVMSSIAARSGPERQRFLREAEMMLPLRHPNVMHVFAFGELTDGSPYIVMQYLEGEPLGAFFRRQELMTLPMALQIATEAASGLAAAHAEGIVHRDVKPDNIFLVGSPGHVRAAKVLDFGLARLSGATGLTAKGMIVGTPEYMAPEQAVNDKADARTDVYGLGVVLYRLVTGALPFPYKNEIDLLAAQFARRPPPLLHYGVDAHPALQRVIFGALRKVPGNRYPSMSDFMADLDRLRAERYEEVTGPPSLHDEDDYIPKGAFSQSIAKILKKKGAALPER